MLRSALLVPLVFALFACGEQRDERMHNVQDSSEPILSTYDVEDETVHLTASGVGGHAWYDKEADLEFGAPRSRIEAYLTSFLGKPVGRSTNDECGAGPMQFTDYAGSLRVNFQQGKLVGWLLQDDGTTNPVRLVQPFGVENTVSDLRSGLEGFAMIDGSTLGKEFTSSAGIGGFLDEKGVGIDAFYAGTNCFFR